ncbi:hypothetical protein JTE90_005500 [Oedothorax gibbosus]|uniref:tRNA (uracil(54)-C(5))-methyltransferase n=1 Tax=Oedothorax gibbosus TaxID=931172 RepID=A0AAV6UVW8_9ARAC|nr:hypothetical protein JTE90_005500 [Oedothorax gibbosus]
MPVKKMLANKNNQIDFQVFIKMDAEKEPMETVSQSIVEEASSDEPPKMDTEDKKEESDLYSYTKLDDFTSEIYKIELCNLPKFVGFKQLRKFLNGTMDLKTRKVKAIGSPLAFAFITFENEDDRKNALEKLNGYKWKGKVLLAKLAAPAADPMARKRREGHSEDCPQQAGKSGHIRRGLHIPTIKNAVTPFWNVPYEEQLKRKQDDIHKFLMKLSKGIEKVNGGLKHILSQERKKNFHQCCPLNDIRESPVTSGYRNKCEFTCGRHLHTKEKTVGFRLNSYKEGSMSVAEPDDCINIGEPMLRAVKSFQSYIRQSNFDVYNPENHQGHWRQLTVRTSNNSDILLIVVLHPQSLSQEELEKEKSNLKKYFEEGAGSSVGITSVYVQLFSKKSFHEEEMPFIHLMGKKFLEESLLGLKFKISPESFFQINIPAAEILYTMVTNLVGLTPNATVLDVCCGTGTISLCLAQAGGKVIGIEMCPEAVENARQNAKENNVSNVEFVCGKAEDVIIPILNKLDSSEEVVAVVDPPRAGLHQKVLKAIRATPQITQLIYVSCSYTIAYNNFVDLCRSTSNNYKGEAFYPVRADVVDMFPHTPHKEVVLLFKRSNLITIDDKDKTRANSEEEDKHRANSVEEDKTRANLDEETKVEVKCDGDKTVTVTEAEASSL